MLYKQAAKAKTATFRQTFWCVVIGVLSGVYGFQPVLKAMHRDEGALVARYFELSEQTIETETGKTVTVTAVKNRE